MTQVSFCVPDQELSDYSYVVSSHLNLLLREEEVSGCSWGAQPVQQPETGGAPGDERPEEPSATAGSGAAEGSNSGDSVREKFVWSEKVQKLFAGVVLRVGLVGIKPKAIFKCFPRKYGLNCQQLGSHLQKYKLRVQRDYRLRSFDDFQNWMYPRGLQCDALDALAAKWLPDQPAPS